MDFFQPPICRDMRTLDRTRFSKSIQLAAAQVDPKSIPIIKQRCLHDLLKQPRLRGIYERDGSKLIALRPEIRPEDTSALHAESRSYIEEAQIPIVSLNLDLSYDYWQADDILSAILPEDLVADSPAGFTMVGHIAHMNLRQEYLPYKEIIGQVILDKNTAIRTVVNKLDTIDTVYRNFQMEVLAGEEDLIAEQQESGCRFRFDFSKVYWNSRLHTEHERLVGLFSEGDAICDVMAGVGPFAIPAAKKKAIVFANDLNPASYAALLDNIELNKVWSFVQPSNLDGRQCIRESLGQLGAMSATKKTIEVPARPPPRKRTKNHEQMAEHRAREIPIPRTFQHYVMNLPATAIEFLDAFRGLYKNQSPDLALPRIHVHCFTKFEDEEAIQDMTGRINSVLGSDLETQSIDFHHVRRVAPNKDMFCCSFTIPRDVAYAINPTTT